MHRIGAFFMFRPFLAIHGFTALVHPCTSMNGMAWIQWNADVQAVPSHPWLHSISASMHIDERYVMSTWMCWNNAALLPFT
jgi:hypothetical protein